jgi:thioredoxin-like negative regulator of GroEL
MWKIIVLTALLLPTVLLASVTETAIPSTTEAYLAAADSAMEDGDFGAALLLYEEAVERDPHSQVALAGRLIAFSRSRGSGSAIAVAGMN